MSTMHSIINMSVPDTIKWELIVVDNNSSDRTMDLVNDYILETKADIKYVIEKNRGLSHARNRGINGSKGAIIAFTDDDCIVDKHWLTCLVKEFQSDPSIAGIGGRVELYDIRDKPVTIRTLKEKVLFSSTGQLFCLIPGCNMAFARRVFHKTGKFDGRFGAGTKIASAEDSDFIYRVYKSGFKMLYSPDAFVYHNHGRRTDSQVTILAEGYTIGRGAFYCKHILKGDLAMLKMAYWEISALMRNILTDLHYKETRQRSREQLWGLIVGACYYLVTYCKSTLANIRLRSNKSLRA